MPEQRPGRPGQQFGDAPAPRGTGVSPKPLRRRKPKKADSHTGFAKRRGWQHSNLEVAVVEVDGKTRIKIPFPRSATPTYVAHRLLRVLVQAQSRGALAPLAADDVHDRLKVHFRATVSMGRALESLVLNVVAAELQKRQQPRSPGHDRATTTGPAKGAGRTAVPEDSTAHPYNTLIGPFYDSVGVALRLKVTTETVRKHAGLHRLLGCRTAEGTLVYPTFQFGDDDAPLPGLQDVLSTMSEGTNDSWQVALWLRTPSEQLRGATPVDALLEGKAEAVERLAEHTAIRWQK